MKKILYIDMDGVIVDFESGVKKLSKNDLEKYINRYDEVKKIFRLMDPIPSAIESVTLLCQHYDVYVLSTAPWNNPSAWGDKIKWIKKHFGKDSEGVLYRRLILSHQKHLAKGDILIDDRLKNGAEKFEGELILFGSSSFPDWKSVIKHLIHEDK